MITIEWLETVEKSLSDVEARIEAKVERDYTRVKAIRKELDAMEINLWSERNDLHSAIATMRDWIKALKEKDVDVALHGG